MNLNNCLRDKKKVFFKNRNLSLLRQLTTTFTFESKTRMFTCNYFWQREKRIKRNRVTSSRLLIGRRVLVQICYSLVVLTDDSCKRYAELLKNLSFVP